MARATRKQALGRSLSALLKDTEEEEKNREISKSINHINPETVTIEFTKDELKGFASVMKKINKASE